MSLNHNNAHKIEEIRALMAIRREIAQARLQAASSRPASPPPPPQPFPFTALPEEIKIMVLQHALHVKRVTPLYPHIFGNKSTIWRLSLVSKKIRGLAREIYYGENLVSVERMIMPDVRVDGIPMIRVPSISIGLLIRRLEIRLTVQNNLGRGPPSFPDRYHYERGNAITSEGVLVAQMKRDLGILLRNKKYAFGRRTSWQTGLTALRELVIVLRCKGDALCGMCGIYEQFPKRLAIDLRPERVEVKIEGGAALGDQAVSTHSTSLQPPRNVTRFLNRCDCHSECSIRLAEAIRGLVRLKAKGE
jgi:hypothetical protein